MILYGVLNNNGPWCGATFGTAKIENAGPGFSARHDLGKGAVTRTSTRAAIAYFFGG